MPGQTFLKLKKEKKQCITEAFLREFSVKTFDEASLSTVVKQLGIAKGSVYQYFDGKLDLFQYLIGECSAIKMSYLEPVKRDNFPDFWTYFRDLYVHGARFDAEHPLESHFLHQLTENLNSPSVKELFDQMMRQVVIAFEQMVQHEINLGLFRKDIPVSTMGFMLYKIGLSIQEHLVVCGAINPQESIANNEPVYHQKAHLLMETVDSYILLIRKSFDKD